MLVAQNLPLGHRLALTQGFHLEIYGLAGNVTLHPNRDYAEIERAFDLPE